MKKLRGKHPKRQWKSHRLFSSLLIVFFSELASYQRSSDPHLDTYRGSHSPTADFNEFNLNPTHYPGVDGFSEPFQGDHMPPPPPGINSQPSHAIVSLDFWRPSQSPSRPPIRYLGSEILTEMRSMRGGIYYMKSSNFKQKHYVDQRLIFICYFVPSHMIPKKEDKVLNTELGRGLIRREALDLLAYSYIETETGNFSISGNLRLVSERFTINVLFSPANFG